MKTYYRVTSDLYACQPCNSTLAQLRAMIREAGWTDSNGRPVRPKLHIGPGDCVIDENGVEVGVPMTPVEIVGGGDEWADADHALDDAMRAADAEIEEYDQEQSGPIITRYHAVLTPELRELIDAAPHARYA